MALSTERSAEPADALTESPFNDSVSYPRHDGALVRVDFCAGWFHVWLQPHGDPQNYWLGMTRDRAEATELAEALLWNRDATLGHALRSALAQLNGDAWRRD